MTAVFWEEHRGALLSQAYRLVRNVADAHDLVQDTFVRAYVRREQRRDANATLPWLRAILFSIFCNRCARDKRRPDGARLSLDLFADKSAELRTARYGDDPERVALNDDLAGLLGTAINELPTSYRHCLLLCDVEGLCYAETASRLGVSLAVVKSRLHRARRRVRELLIARGYEE